MGLSPPAAHLCTESASVLVTTDQVDKVVEHGDALVGHAGGGRSGQGPPLPPGWVEDLEEVLAVGEGARAEHAAEAQDAVEGGARLGERALQDRLADHLLVVLQRRPHRVPQRTRAEPAVQPLQHLLLDQAETHSFKHLQVLLWI